MHAIMAANALAATCATSNGLTTDASDFQLGACIV
jgi:hypothetical protein